MTSVVSWQDLSSLILLHFQPPQHHIQGQDLEDKCTPSLPRFKFLNHLPYHPPRMKSKLLTFSPSGEALIPPTCPATSSLLLPSPFQAYSGHQSVPAFFFSHRSHPPLWTLPPIAGLIILSKPQGPSFCHLILNLSEHPSDLVPNLFSCPYTDLSHCPGQRVPSM